MKNKKTIALAMAAATVAPMVVPAFAAEVQQSKSLPVQSTGVYNGKVLVDVRAALTGEEIVGVFTRSQAFNTNSTPEISDDTLNDNLGEGARIFAHKVGTAFDQSNAKYVIAKKADTSTVNSQKANLETAKAEISELKAKGYTVTTKNIREVSFDGTNFIDGEVEVTVTKAEVTRTYVFRGVDDSKLEDSVNTLRPLFNAYAQGTHNDSIVMDMNIAANYSDFNRVKYIIEQNESKFDIVKSEIANGSDRTLVVTVYLKGAKNIEAGRVITITLVNSNKIDTDLIVNMPSKTDVDGHWAEQDVKNAMFDGYIDVTSNFRPKDGITRAEFAKMVCTMFGINTTAAGISGLEEPFHDVTSSDWHYKYIVALYNYKTNLVNAAKGSVINGYEGDLFKPNAKIKREEAAKMIAAAYEIKHNKGLNIVHGAKDTANGFASGDIDTAPNGIAESTKIVNKEVLHRDIVTKFKDDKNIASWADESVAALSGSAQQWPGLQIIGGNPDGTFQPKSEINRAEALCMINRAK